MVSVLKEVLQEEGVSGWFRGFSATMLNTFSQRKSALRSSNEAFSILFFTEYAYFFFYSFVRNAYISRIKRKLPPGSNAPALSTVAELLLGAIAGALAQIFTIPVSVIATRQQVGRSLVKSSSTGPSRSQEQSEDNDDSFWAIAKEIVEEEGITGLWLGIKPGLVLTVNPAITYGVFERVKSVLLRARGLGENDKLSALLSFLVGAFSKTLATVVCFGSRIA
jgi:adenine nucleotide transporter 17